jgi:hypothetical protein
VKLLKLKVPFWRAPQSKVSDPVIKSPTTVGYCANIELGEGFSIWPVYVKGSVVADTGVAPSNGRKAIKVSSLAFNFVDLPT